MQTIQSRIYTNVILTVIAMLLAILALRPVIVRSAGAQDEERKPSASSSSAPPGSGAIFSGDTEVANANREIAKAIQGVADAIKKSGESQQAIADAIGELAAPEEESK